MRAKHNWSRALICLLILGFIMRAAFSVLPFESLQSFVYDDAYYYFTVAKTLVQTGMIFSADGTTYTNGFHPLWLVSIIPFWLVNGTGGELPIRMTIVWAALLDTLAALLLFFLLRMFFGLGVSLALSGFYLFNPVNIIQAVSGMETPINSFFIVALLYVVVALKKEMWVKRKHWILFGLVAGLLLLARTDNLFLVGGAFIFLFLKNRKRTNLYCAAGVSGLIIAPWFLLNFLKFHTILQTSAWTYPWIYHNEFLTLNGSYFSWAILGKCLELCQSCAKNLGSYFGSMVLLIGMVGIVVGRVMTEKTNQLKPVLRYLGWALIAVVVYLFFHVFIRWFPRIWYHQSVFIVLIPFLGLALSLFKRKLVPILIGLIFLCVSLFTIIAPTGSGAFMRAWLAQLRAPVAVEMIDRIVPPGEIVGAWNSGYVQYWSNRKVINLDGLANNEVLDYYKQGNPLEYLRKMNITWIVDNPYYLTWSFGKYFQPGELEKYFKIRAEDTGIGLEGNRMWCVEILPEEEEE